MFAPSHDQILHQHEEQLKSLAERLEAASSPLRLRSHKAQMNGAVFDSWDLGEYPVADWTTAHQQIRLNVRDESYLGLEQSAALRVFLKALDMASTKPKVERLLSDNLAAIKYNQTIVALMLNLEAEPDRLGDFLITVGNTPPNSKIPEFFKDVDRTNLQ